MKRFKSFIEDDKGFYIDDDGKVVLSKPIGDKKPNTKRIVKNVSEGFDLTSFKKSSPKKIDHAYHKPRHDLGDKHPRTHLDDSQYNKNIFGETGHPLSSAIYGSDIEEVGSLSSELEQKMSSSQHKAFHHYTTQKSVSNKSKSASSHIAEHFLTTHKNKTDSTTVITKLKGKDKDCAEHLKTAAKPLGREVHLYSGVHPSFVKAIKHAEKHTDGVVHSPAHISTTHDIHTAARFAVHSGHDSTQFFPLNKNTNNENVGKTTKHMIHVDAKASDKGIHMSGVEGNEHAAEAETVLPPGTQLKYSHTTHHYYTVIDSNGDHDHHRIDVHHCTIHK